MIEKERRWLLKRLPNINFNEIIPITQFYIDGYRYRASSQISGGDCYEKIKKVSIGIGHNEEIEIEQISKETFFDLFANRERSISKQRFVFFNEKHKFEIDEFENMNLTIMEIEGIELTDIIDFPPEIEKEIIMEITGFKQLNNYNLAN